MSGVTISELVSTIVDTKGPKGQATRSVQRLRETLESAFEREVNPVERQRIAHELEFVKGYQETPATLLADLQARPLKRKR